MGEVIGTPPAPPPEMAFVDAEPELVPLSPPKVVEGPEPEVVADFVQGALKRVPELRWDAELEKHVATGRLLCVDDAGTEHPVV